MEITKLSDRLKRVASFVPQDAKLLDVGSDHAYLPIYLLQNGRIQNAIAGEVVEGPYQSAQKNVVEHGFEEEIQVRLANGLAAFEAADGITVITIAGMGGRLIADILDKGKDKLEGIERLILQPNNREDDLRNWLSSHGFKIIAEDILEEAGKIYEIMVIEKGQQSLTAEDKRFGPFLKQSLSPTFKVKWQKEMEKLIHALTQIPENYLETRKEIEDKLEKIKEILYEG
ncbi:putative tRNA-m1A22 methylase [Streptococcus sp. DD10]|uniref:tRNA (adenine(22)-N(1))-methyltransferase n=1 Tax=Streptococcus sp. DD10 TaxID=1777878 RepID=UPI00079C56FE|nr:tRNA (adenine(22)-N(1))-methyltransferase TrmK [Streptococcus sp. DD10]KXT73354.1 putative tRNA-m1A22 methylase [Streptococcus sp. DD10]